ncbi:MAG: DUF234 domain-containing protein [Pseudonocardia sp.]
MVGERVLNAEFPPATQAREVLGAIGAGETTFTRIRDRTGINEGSLSRTLGVLVDDKRVVSALRPLSGAPSRLTRYVVTDSYLRFWLRFVAPRMEVILRGRGTVAAAEIIASWPQYRGRAVEPLVRAGVERLLPDTRLGTAQHVGVYWTRNNDVEVDLVGADRSSAPAGVAFLGSVTWRDRAAFTREDLLHLAAQREKVPGASGALLAGVARTAVTADVDVGLTAQDLLDAWS